MKITETKSTVDADCSSCMRKLASRGATENIDQLEFLLPGCGLELIDREHRLKASKFPT